MLSVQMCINVKNRQTAWLAFLLIAGLACGQFVSADELVEREWKLLTSANFRVHTVLPVDRTVELLRHLEVMRAALDDPSAAPTYQSSVPTVIVALDDGDDYWRVGAPRETIGIFNADTRENVIFIQDTERSSGVRVILHEYVHYLHHKNGRAALPKWFEEGRAEYLSQSRIYSDNFEYGLRAESRLPSLNFAAWLPAVEIITRSEIDGLDELQGDLFYGQSWLLVHYLYSRAAGSAEVMEMVARYNNHLSNGLDKIAAFERGFDLKVDELQELLQTYLMENEFESKSVAINTALPGFSPRVTSLTAAEAQIALGRMAMRFQNDADAERWFRAALSDDVTRPHAEAGLGTVEGFRGDIDAAEKRFEAAIYLVSYDFNIWMDYAQFWARRASETRDYEKRKFFAKRLEESLRNALTISDATPELNSLMGYSYLMQGKDIDEAIEFLEAAVRESPIDQSSRLLLATAYMMFRQFEQAIAMAETVLRYEHEASHATATARNIIDEATMQMNDR